MGLRARRQRLGAAVALAELERSSLSEADIGVNWALWSGRGSASAGIELLNHEIVVMGMSPAWSGPLAIDHAVMADAVDIEPVRAALARLGLGAAGQLAPAQRARLVALLGKAEASHDGRLRGHRHTMLDDSDIAATRHARAFVLRRAGRPRRTRRRSTCPAAPSIKAGRRRTCCAHRRSRFMMRATVISGIAA